MQLIMKIENAAIENGQSLKTFAFAVIGDCQFCGISEFKKLAEDYNTTFGCDYRRLNPQLKILFSDGSWLEIDETAAIYNAPSIFKYKTPPEIKENATAIQRLDW
jgi:hypothetical protein